MRSLHLKAREERRILAGHRWIFSNEVDSARSPLPSFEPGEEVRVQASGGRPLGAATVNPHSLIAGRIYSANPRRRLDDEFLADRITRALALREKLFDTPHYRLVFGEADGLPGLVADRFGDLIAVQITTAGMERVREQVCRALATATGARDVVLLNEVEVRELEGLELYSQAALGRMPEEVRVEESGLVFHAPLAGGQKTGWFFDQRANRAHAAGLAAGGRVLDVFSYVGGFGVLAAARGARQAVCVDSSKTACDHVRRNAAEAGVDAKVQAVAADAFAHMEELAAAGERFDVVCIDPPAFVKRKKDRKKGMAGYARANRLALSLVADGGFLVTSSCSRPVTMDELRGVVGRESARTGLGAAIIRQAFQGPDHPVHPAMPETLYLKTITARIKRSTGGKES
jgi:23S rRNA (cytosine1962-C5)-methyltransferase